jgi:HSP20 family protein
VAELPGVEEHDIEAEGTGTVLTISAERGDRKYSKRVELPAPVTGELKTTYKHGVFEVKLKKAN